MSVPHTSKKYTWVVKSKSGVVNMVRPTVEITPLQTKQGARIL